MAIEILGTSWFSGRATIGVVRVKTEFDGIKYYIGVGQGYDENADSRLIAEWGWSTFPSAAGDVLFGVDHAS